MSREASPEQIQAIRDLHTLCVSPAEIARQLRLPQATVLAAIDRLRDGGPKHG